MARGRRASDHIQAERLSNVPGRFLVHDHALGAQLERQADGFSPAPRLAWST
jgi:hypothetical protein